MTRTPRVPGSPNGADLVLFDTNVWRHLADHANAMEARQVLKGARRRGAVSTLNIDEIVRTPHATDRQAMMDVACGDWWTRLSPIGFLDVEQLVSAVRRHRPEWLRDDPDWKRFAYERGAYTSNTATSFWNVVQHNPIGYAEMNAPNDDIRDLQAEITRLARASVPPFHSTSVADAMVQPIDVTVPGTPIRDRLVEAWRFQSARTVWLRLDPQQSGPLLALWFDCFVDRSAFGPYEWWSFWMDDVEPADVSREWLRCATFHLQATRRVGSGVAGDLALVSHLIDVGTLATCDRPFHEIVEKIRSAAPFEMGTTLYAPHLDGLLAELRGANG